MTNILTIFSHQNCTHRMQLFLEFQRTVHTTNNKMTEYLSKVLLTFLWNGQTATLCRMRSTLETQKENGEFWLNSASFSTHSLHLHDSVLAEAPHKTTHKTNRLNVFKCNLISFARHRAVALVYCPFRKSESNI